MLRRVLSSNSYAVTPIDIRAEGSCEQAPRDQARAIRPGDRARRPRGRVVDEVRWSGRPRCKSLTAGFGNRPPAPPTSSRQTRRRDAPPAAASSAAGGGLTDCPHTSGRRRVGARPAGLLTAAAGSDRRGGLPGARQTTGRWSGPPSSSPATGRSTSTSLEDATPRRLAAALGRVPFQDASRPIRRLVPARRPAARGDLGASAWRALACSRCPKSRTVATSAAAI